MKPYFETILCDTETPVSIFKKIADREPYAFLLESAESHERFGRYSIIGFDPLYIHEFGSGSKINPFETLEKSYKSIRFSPEPSLPRFQAAFVGYFNYETVRFLENLDLPVASSSIPESIFYFPKNLLIFDHFKRTITLIAYSKAELNNLNDKFTTALNKSNSTIDPMRIGVAVKQQISKSFQKLVKKAKEDIAGGEIFQVVLCRKFEQKTVTEPFDIYRNLRSHAPSPYMYYLKYPNFSIIGSSPETLVRTEDDDIIVRPIAGTRRRGINQKKDNILAKELLNDKKEQAEHMMLVDLGRNDVGKVAKPGTVRVSRLMEIEKYSHVMHLVSEVRAKRKKNASLFDIFKSTFPAGTLSGAPKIRAMEIISKMEKSPRGIYGGAVGYFDMTGNMDFAIAIRTMTYAREKAGKKGRITLRAGAGIVYDSVPAHEDLECRNKAKGPLEAVTL